jgi:hypothetical protein
VLKNPTDWAQRVTMTRDSYVTWVLSEPFFKLYEEGPRSIFNHLQAFSFWWWKIVAPVNLGKPFRLFLGNLSLALALKQAITTFNEPVVREDRNSRMGFKDYFKSFASSLEV